MNPYLSSNNHNDTDPSDLHRYYKNSHAIIIGVSKYKEEISLPNAVNDALAIKSVLEEKYDFNKNNVITVLDEEATNDKIRWIFDEKLQDCSTIETKDRVLIYYSGHGKVRVLFDSDGHEVKTGYIVPFDSQRSSYHKSIMMKDMVRACQTCRARHILVILDCCCSGYVMLLLGVLNQKYQENMLMSIIFRI